jgi:hypothetical protein
MQDQADLRARREKALADGQRLREELEGWFRVPSTWPDLTFRVFNRWFECRYHSMVLDLADAPFLTEEA